MHVTVILEDRAHKHHFPGIVEALSNCDLLMLSTRRRTPPKAELDAVRKYLDSGKPLVVDSHRLPRFLTCNERNRSQSASHS